MRWHIGCSGFYYRSWKGDFYPADIPQKKWFDHYAGIFNSLELNVTFYRFPQVRFLQNWYAKAPDRFIFSAKMPRLITHYKRFNDTRRMVDDVYNTLSAGLKEKLGCVLFQLPPQIQYSEQMLEKIIGNTNADFKNVIEFRHSSWWNQGVYNTLKENNIIFCGQSYPQLPDEVVANSQVIYYRFHGTPKLYHSPYPVPQIKNVAKQIIDAGGSEAHVFFNNTDSGYAARNALSLMRFLKRESHG